MYALAIVRLLTQTRSPGHDAFMPVPLFESMPEDCPFGHKLWPGMAQVSWKPCLCAPAREASELGRGMGHVCVSCNTCHEQLLSTVFYEPPHSDDWPRPLSGWVTRPGP